MGSSYSLRTVSCPACTTHAQALSCNLDQRPHSSELSFVQTEINNTIYPLLFTGLNQLSLGGVPIGLVPNLSCSESLTNQTINKCSSSRMSFHSRKSATILLIAGPKKIWTFTYLPNYQTIRDLKMPRGEFFPLPFCLFTGRAFTSKYLRVVRHRPSSVNVDRLILLSSRPLFSTLFGSDGGSAMAAKFIPDSPACMRPRNQGRKGKVRGPPGAN
ncbi:hypothetical protein BGW80DRAFT_58944 [Lactifluus volemus]|nr:hypothetical protein BGW80DRAFT_58944 [Lactifluus volemus]